MATKWCSCTASWAAQGKYPLYSTPDIKLSGVISDWFSVNIQFNVEIGIFLLSFMEFLKIKLMNLEPALSLLCFLA